MVLPANTPGILTGKRVLYCMKGVPHRVVPAKRGILLPQCYFCGEVPSQGIHGGVIIKKAFICSACEENIVNLKVGSTNYRAVVNKLKEILG